MFIYFDFYLKCNYNKLNHHSMLNATKVAERNYKFIYRKRQ
ncbi:hypothetical protein RUMLAC_00149 [[Ruminococcus] lactaris ATCC 29176]|uniref:Uncharacterized protein n=1 Tax=[Ruminococcus] lactaris ATCC 29176 TaxID=471875 RepID=B5CL30_9FIRM|nr:hypothetical protein RUMLAC_00149 [[Ruminococcus] lactaris ATCC 29176]